MTHNYVCVCPRQNCQVHVCVTLADDHRAVGRPVSIWGSGHFLPEMSWSAHLLWSLISTFFPPSLIFLQAEEYLWQALYFIDGMSVCKLIFMQTPQWIYNIQHAASSAYRLKVLQRGKTGSGVHTGWPHFLSWCVLCVFPCTHITVPFGDPELSPFYKHQLRSQQFCLSIGMYMWFRGRKEIY